ncbi:MAG: DUF2207 domain-containing protein [Gemmatimonadota bacterium]
MIGALGAFPAEAQERILSYDIEIDVRLDGSLDVAEHITVFAEGRNIRRGIYRDFPTRYRDRFGNRVRVSLEVLDVEMNGSRVPWFTERVANGVRINTGDDSFLDVPGEYTYTIDYRTTRQLGFFDEHDELYWNAIGTGWIFPIDTGSVEVRLPEPVPVEQMGAEGYTGPQGASDAGYVAELTGPGIARYALTEPLAPGEGLTIVLTFPKGVVAEPGRVDRVRWFLADNLGVLVALAGLAGLLLFCVRRWKEIGRDPAEGVVIPRYDPPAGWSPAATRYLRRMGYDDRCFTSDVLDLAVQGRLRIHRDEEARKGEWALEETSTTVASAPSQSALLGVLFKGRSSMLELDASNGTVLRAARSAQQLALDEQLHGPYFRRNGKSAFQAFLITATTGGLAFLAAGGNGIPAIVITLVFMVGVSALFTHLVRAPTPEGRELLDELAGLELYLTVAERDELAGMPGPGGAPPLDAGRYESLLPFAVALAVEDAWTEKFTAAVGVAAAAEAARGMHWYAGRGPITDLGSFSRSVGSSLSSQIASAASPPGSGSGSGGGGSSGGGGGGGGGGGR